MISAGERSFVTVTTAISAVKTKPEEVGDPSSNAFQERFDKRPPQLSEEEKWWTFVDSEASSSDPAADGNVVPDDSRDPDPNAEFAAKVQMAQEKQKGRKDAANSTSDEDDLDYLFDPATQMKEDQDPDGPISQAKIRWLSADDHTPEQQAADAGR